MKKTHKIIDLYAGAGGLSLGAARAGFMVQAAVELDPQASATHAVNFPLSTHIQEDISKLDGDRLILKSGVDPTLLAGLIGGPPCQGFSPIGLQATADPRNELFCDFFRLVAETKPAFFLAENVPGVLAKRNALILERGLGRIPRNYIVLKPFTVRASDYGAPTIRTRVFFYGYDPDRIEALAVEDFLPKNVGDVRVCDALAHLPKVRRTWQTEEQSWRSVGALDDSDFGKRVVDRIPPGVGNQEALERLRSKRQVSGFLGTMHENATIKRFDALGPGESDSVSKCMRLDPKGYCPTLRAGTGREHGSFQAIRPVHPTSPRVITPREGARLQGFPDWFQFHSTKWNAFRQIGNSVSPIVAEALLRRVHGALS